MIRKKGIIAFIIIGLVLAVFGFFFAGGLVKKTIEFSGRLVFGAAVDISELDLSFTRLSLKIKGFRVGNKDSEWFNLFEIGEIRFQLGPRQLLEQKIWIEDVAVENIRFGTSRTTSAKLPKPKKEINASDKTWLGQQNAVTQEIQNLPISKIVQDEKKINVNEIVNPVQLTAPTAIKDAETMVNTKQQQNQDLLAKLNIAPRVNEIKSQLNAVNFNEKDPLKIKSELKKLKEIKKNSDALSSEVRQTAAQLRADYQTIDNALAQIEQLKEKDYQSIVSTLSLNQVNQSEIARLVFGPEWLERSKTFLYWLDKLQFFLPAKKDDSAGKSRRVKGTYITFPRQKSYPFFFLKQALLSTVSQEPTGFNFQGKVTEVSSNPALTGQPAVISLQGQNPNFDFTGTINHTGNVGRDSFQLIITDTNISGFTLGNSPLLPKKIAGGRADINLQLIAEGDEITLTIDIFPRNLSFEASDIPGGNLSGEIASFLTTTQNLQINGKIAGRKGERLKFQITSNIDELLSQAIRKRLEAQLETVKQQVREKINQAVDGPKTQLLNQVQQKRNETEALIKEKETALAEVDNLVKDNLEKMEQKTRDSLQDKLKEKLKIPK